MKPEIDCYWTESFGRKIVNTDLFVLDYSPNGQLTAERTKSQSPALLYMMTQGRGDNTLNNGAMIGESSGDFCHFETQNTAVYG